MSNFRVLSHLYKLLNQSNEANSHIGPNPEHKNKSNGNKRMQHEFPNGIEENLSTNPSSIKDGFAYDYKTHSQDPHLPSQRLFLIRNSLPYQKQRDKQNPNEQRNQSAKCVTITNPKTFSPKNLGFQIARNYSAKYME
jgi:hypothetical protein